jgi:glutamate---cysteine ligase / carboxylate-amine ligase
MTEATSVPEPDGIHYRMSGNRRFTATADEGLPDWACWTRAKAAYPWTVGIEEEVMLLDPCGWSAANRIDDVLSLVPPDVAASVSAETHACVLELRTTPQPTVADATAELEVLRRSVDGTLRKRLALRAASAGTHPLATRSKVSISSGPRYQHIEASMRALARREPTMAQHVHVAVPDADAAVRAVDGLRGDLPILLALSANSPFWRAADSGFASVRTPIFSMFPRVGIARHFGSYDAYVGTIAPLLRSGALREPGFLWWDARLRPTLGTVEVRILDAQSRVQDAAALAAVIQCLVRRHAQAPAQPAVASELLEENRFLAARDGIDAKLIDHRSCVRRPVRDTLDELLAACEPFADGLDCTAELAAAGALAEDPGYARQRRLASRHGLANLPARLADQFTTARRENVVA